MKKKFKELKKERNGLHTVNASIKELEKKKSEELREKLKDRWSFKDCFFFKFFWQSWEKLCVYFPRGFCFGDESWKWVMPKSGGKVTATFFAFWNAQWTKLRNIWISGLSHSGLSGLLLGPLYSICGPWFAASPITGISWELNPGFKWRGILRNAILRNALFF